MKDLFVRWLHAVVLFVFGSGLLFLGTGCGAIKAAGNPKVAWALNDPAPMSVVVRRADVAEKTAENVDKILTDTPVTEDGAWLTKVTPDPENAKKTMTDLRQHELYLSGVRVVAAEYWAKALPATAAAAKKTTPQPAAAPKAAEPVAANEPTKKNAKKGVKADKPSALAKGDAKRGKKTASHEEVPESLPIEAPPSASPKSGSILAAIDKDLGDAWAKVMEKRKAIADLKAQIAEEDAAADKKGITDAEKKEHKTKVEALEKKVDPLSDEAEKLAKEFVPKVKAAASKAPAETRERFGPVLVALKQAVDDADISNGAAAIRYPLAASTLLDSAKQMASVYVADVVEEKTGKRPSTQGITPGVTLEGGDVKITLNGLSSSDLGKLSIGDVTTEVASRTGKWVKHATGLLGSISATKGTLEFEDDVLSALLDGFKGAGYAVPAPIAIPDPPPVQGAQGGQPNG